MTHTDCRGLRLLLVGPYPPPFGGVASHVVTLIPGLRARGAADIAIVSFGDRDIVQQIEGATLYRFAAQRHGRDLALPRNWRTIGAAAATLGGAGFSIRQVLGETVRAALIDAVAKRHDSRVVSFYQGDLSLALLPCTNLWNAGRGTVLTVFGENYDNPAFFGERRSFVERFMALPRAVVSSSKHCAMSFAQIGVTRPIEPVYYGVDLARFSAPALRDPYRAELGVAPDEVLAVYMGRFSEEMGVGRMLEIGPTLLERLPQLKLLLAGAKGPLAAAAATFAEHHSGRVRVLHDVPFTLQPSIYAASDMVIAPSHDQHACMGMSIKEAMAAQRPVVGSRAGGVPEAIVDQETGFLVPLDDSRHVDAKLFLEAVQLLAADGTLRARLGAAGRRRAEDIFSMERTIDRMGEIFVSADPGHSH